MIFSGNSNINLANQITEHLNQPIGKASVNQFSDGEISIEILENVRGKDVFIVQPTSAPTNTNLMELIIMGDALRRASAGRVTAVIPYFGYARQDRRPLSARVAISAKVVADMIAIVGINRVLTVDLHADQIQGFFDIPVDNIYASPLVLDDIKQKHTTSITIVAPDHGGVVRARAIAKRLDANLAIIDKRRPQNNQAEVMNIIGDVTGQHCILIDDIIDTAGTLAQASKALKKAGSKTVNAYCTHPVLSGKALQNITESDLNELVVTNTIQITPEAKMHPKIRQLNISNLIAEAIRRISYEQSISELFK